VISPGLPPDQAKVGRLRDVVVKLDAALQRVVEGALSLEILDHFLECAYRINPAAIVSGACKDQGTFLFVPGWDEQFLTRLGAEGNREYPRHPANLAVQPEFPDDDVIALHVLRQVGEIPRCLKHDDREWQIEPRPILLEGRGSKVDLDFHFRVRNP
jgi:hypothetical protein